MEAVEANEVREAAEIDEDGTQRRAEKRGKW
jgi:hypothetical protein